MEGNICTQEDINEANERLSKINANQTPTLEDSDDDSKDSITDEMNTEQDKQDSNSPKSDIDPFKINDINPNNASSPSQLSRRASVSVEYPSNEAEAAATTAATTFLDNTELCTKIREALQNAASEYFFGNKEKNITGRAANEAPHLSCSSSMFKTCSLESKKAAVDAILTGIKLDNPDVIAPARKWAGTQLRTNLLNAYNTAINDNKDGLPEGKSARAVLGILSEIYKKHGGQQKTMLVANSTI